MPQTPSFHEDVFYAYFRPFRHPASSFDIWGGHGLETFGSDWQLAADFDQNFVWTVVDGDNGHDQWITPGMRRVNRVCYLLSRVPHRWVPLDFRCEGRPRPITPLGLARRIAALQSVMRSYQTHAASPGILPLKLESAP